MNDIEILHALNGMVQKPLVWNKKQQNDAIDRAVDALEKHEPTKIKKDRAMDETPSGDIYEREIPVCPSCPNIYLSLNQPFCDTCGQRLDWSVEE